MLSELETTKSETETLSTRGYKLLKKVGEGSYAKVYLSEYQSPDRIDAVKSTLACKVIDTTKAPKDFVRKFLPREIDVLIKINHPHIIHIHSIFQRKIKYFMFMRYAEKGDLLDFILKHGPIAESQARVWFRQLALAIQYIHTLEIAHRDLKCENVLITNNFNVKVTDFGFARSVIDPIDNKPCKSETYCGSLSYAAPEILRGSPYHPKIADVWSLGVILYITLNKGMPFDDTNVKRMYDQQINRRWRFRAKVNDHLSDQVKKLIANMLEPDTKKRSIIDDVISNEWLAMDARLVQMSAAETAALNQVKESMKKEKKKPIKDSAKTEENTPDFVKILKLEDGPFTTGVQNSVHQES